MIHKQNTLSKSYLNLLRNKSSRDNEDYKKVFNHVKLIYKKDMTVNSTTETVLKDHPLFLIKTDSIIHLSWDILMLFTLIYLAISIPFYIGFYIAITGALVYIEFAVQVTLLLDIFVTVNSSYFVKGFLVVSRKKIFCNYMKGWFWLDILSSFPYNWLLRSPLQNEVFDYNTDFFKFSQILSLVKILRLVRVIKLIKLVKAKKFLASIEDSLVNHKIAIAFIITKLVIFMMIVAHWAACVWHLSAVETNTTEAITWKKVIEASSGEDINTGMLYVNALYWAFTTMATVGFGDIHAYSDAEKVISIITMACSSTIFAYILGTFSSLINTATANETTHREIIIAVNRYMKKAKLSTDLQFRVRRYLDYIFQSQNKSDLAEENVMQMLSLNLKDEIYTFLHGNIISSCEFFKTGGLTPGILSQIYRILKFEAFAPTDSVFKQGETSRTLYFVLSGKVDLYHLNTNYSYITLQPRTCFGEIGFFTAKPRTASAKCIGFTEFFSVLHEEFENLISGSSIDIALMENVKNSCQEEDYSVLKLKCYLCSEFGHIANSCKRILFNYDKHLHKKQKLSEQENKPKVVRVNNKQSLPSKKRFKARMVMKRAKKEKGLREKIKEFAMMKEDSLKYKETIDVAEPEPKRYSFIYHITESSHEDEDEDDRIRAPIFDVNLVKNDEETSSIELNRF